MRWVLTRAAAAALALGISACSGYGDSSQGNPNGPTSAPPDAITIDIIGDNGGQSFSPNPSTVAPGQTVVWHNLDSTTHRVVLDDRELDTGNIGPKAFSQPMTLVAQGTYHCSIHPDMVGRIAGQK